MRPKPTLFHMLFGDQAEPARMLASERLLRWADTFDEWIEQRRQVSEHAARDCLRIWGEFLRIVPKPPWEVEEVDVLAYVRALDDGTKGWRRLTTRLEGLSKFYRFAAEKLAPHEVVKDPTSGVDRDPNKLRPYVVYLSAEEAQGLLAAVERKASVIGKRDYALILGCLLSGLRIEELFNLRWKDLRVDWEHGRGWAQRSGPERPAAELVMQVVEAIWDYLEASGRLETIQAQDFIFAPTRIGIGKIAPNRAEEWIPTRSIQQDFFSMRLRGYATWAGLDETQITMTVLRNTAIMLRIEAGDTVEEIQHFFNFAQRTHIAKVIARLTHQVRRPLWKRGAAAFGGAVSAGATSAGLAETRIGPVPALSRSGAMPAGAAGLPAGAGDGSLAGADNLYSLALPHSELAQAGKEGMDDEISALRVVMMRTLHRALDAGEVRDQLRLLEAFSNAASRLSILLKTQRELDGGEDLFEQTVQSLSQEILVEQGWQQPTRE